MEVRGVVLDDAPYEDEVVQVDGAAEADADVDPGDTVSLSLEMSRKALGSTYILLTSFNANGEIFFKLYPSS